MRCLKAARPLSAVQHPPRQGAAGKFRQADALGSPPRRHSRRRAEVAQDGSAVRGARAGRERHVLAAAGHHSDDLCRRAVWFSVLRHLRSAVAPARRRQRSRHRGVHGRAPALGVHWFPGRRLSLLSWTTCSRSASAWIQSRALLPVPVGCVPSDTFACFYSTILWSSDPKVDTPVFFQSSVLLCLRCLAVKSPVPAAVKARLLLPRSICVCWPSWCYCPWARSKP